MVCARCGHVNPDEARFCSSCGAPLAADDDAGPRSRSPRSKRPTSRTSSSATSRSCRPGVGLLVVRHGPETGSSYRLEQPVTAIGRHPDSDIFLDDITVSRRHVELDKDDQGYVLRDVGSLNGTYVNRERVDEARLHHGDEVQIGRYRLSFVLGGRPRT